MSSRVYFNLCQTLWVRNHHNFMYTIRTRLIFMPPPWIFMTLLPRIIALAHQKWPVFFVVVVFKVLLYPAVHSGCEHTHTSEREPCEHTCAVKEENSCVVHHWCGVTISFQEAELFSFMPYIMVVDFETPMKKLWVLALPWHMARGVYYIKPWIYRQSWDTLCKFEVDVWRSLRKVFQRGFQFA